MVAREPPGFTVVPSHARLDLIQQQGQCLALHVVGIPIPTRLEQLCALHVHTRSFLR
jgi:hypothetical protein